MGDLVQKHDLPDFEDKTMRRYLNETFGTNYPVEDDPNQQSDLSL